jgi:hypothetical protein
MVVCAIAAAAAERRKTHDDDEERNVFPPATVLASAPLEVIEETFLFVVRLNEIHVSGSLARYGTKSFHIV